MAESFDSSDANSDTGDSPKAQRKPRGGKKLVARLIGLETEYATLIADEVDMVPSDLPASQEIYSRICDAIRRDQPTVAGLFDSEQMFLASGGAVTFESHPTLHALPGGLIEIATPEVHSPDELLACQRSIDGLVADAADDIEMDIDLRILKNSSDALGHVYGCQENYETEVATGAWLWIYRGFVCLLWCMQIVSLLFSLPILAFALTLLFLYRFVTRGFASLATDPAELFESVPKWVTSLLIGMLRIVHIPTVVVLRFVVKHVAFRKQRKYLTALLVSRVALCGTGDLDHEGRFRLSAKAMAVDKVSDMGGFRGERPIFVHGHWLGQFCAKSFLSLSSTFAMLRKRQRLQIGLSDSNMSDLAEYVKVGSVSLLLDMIESGGGRNLPIMPRPIDALHRFTRDWNLISRVKTCRGELSALEIQSTYLKEARQFVESIPASQRGESELVLERWSELLNVVSRFRHDASDVQDAVGRVDWMTKQWLMNQAGGDAEWSHKKKIDLRYHELSFDGYYYQLAGLDASVRLIDQQRIDSRRKSPPASSPAARRGWLIREFAGSGEPLQSDWGYAVVGSGRKRKRIEFARTDEPN